MPWTEGPVDDRTKLMQQWEEGESTIEELAARAGVTRQCVHKWLKRWKEEGVAGMEERSRAPLQPRRVDSQKVQQLVALKTECPDYGPEKLVVMLTGRDGIKPMAASTAGRILDAYGLVKHRKRRIRVGPPSSALSIPIPGPGHTLTADHKGYFCLGNGKHCHPLTLVDPVSRYLYAIEAQSRPTIDAARGVFDRIFREFGLPDQILTDNGSPFASARALGGMTALSKWWIKLGIHVARIAPGRPQQNGRHERVHKTLKQAAVCPPQKTMIAQQRRFDAFRYEYNWLRPHSALGQQPPAQHLSNFRRSYSGQAPDELCYPAHLESRRVRETGEIKVDGRRYFLSEVLAGELVGIEPFAPDRVRVFFGTCYLAWIDLTTGSILKNDGAE